MSREIDTDNAEDVLHFSSATCPTQVDVYGTSQVWGTTTNDVEALDSESGETPWGQLVSVTSDEPTRDLYSVPEGLQENVFNVHTLGRAAKHCNLLLDASLKRVSNVHCRLYCMPSASVTGKVQAWIEDTSNNGTFINRDTRLKKGVPRKLHDRDEISLISPVCPKNQDPDVYSAELKKAGFIFRMLHPRADLGGLDDGTGAGGVAAAAHPRGIFWNVQHEEYDGRRDGTGDGHGNGKGEQEVARGDDENVRNASSSSSSSSSSVLSTVAAAVVAAAAAAAENENAKSKPLAPTKDKLNTSHLARLNTVHRMVGQERMLQDYYDIGSRIGGGGEANVFRAVHKTTGEYWAVKVTQLRNYRVGGQLPVDLLKEAEIVRKLKHDHIVALKDVFMTTENLFLVMELCRGGDLLDRILDKKEKYADAVQERRRAGASAAAAAQTETDVHDGYTEHEAQKVMQQLVDAITYMHTQHIAHRDLKPENIVLVSRDSDVDVKVTDFGLAKVIDNTKGFKTFCGTSHYIAPEVLRVRKDPIIFGSGASTSADMDVEVRYSLEADMWSLGVIMYVLLSGAFPFADEHGTAMNARILAGTYALTDPVWRGVSAQAKALMGRLLDTNPETRITAPQCLEHPWLMKRGEGGILRGKADGTSSATDPSAKRSRHGVSE